MKTTLFQKLLAAVCVTGGLFMTSCSNDSIEAPISEIGNASLEITLSLGGSTGTRATGPISAHKTTTATEFEKLITKCDVFVFNQTTGALEKHTPVTYDADADAADEETGWKINVTGLQTGSKKKVVVVANVPQGMSDELDAISQYDDLLLAYPFAETQGQFYQESGAEIGLLMTGESTESSGVSLTETSVGTTKIAITLSRRVAKVVLQSLSLAPTSEAIAALSNETYTLQSVGLQNMRKKYSLLNGNPTPANSASEYYNAYASTSFAADVATTTSALTSNFLSEAISGVTFESTESVAATTVFTASDEDNVLHPYFYVLPNHNNDGHGAIMTFAVVVGTATHYYPIEMKHNEIQTIEPNKVYLVDVTLKELHLTTDDPTVVPSDAGLDIVLTVADWTETVSETLDW
ncbi:MAG: hypothetical protein LBM62_06285 [Mediterranea sp.]|jgi:hypothetical protein|nr:hypothetical protein [Mediterranea sp.]